MPIQTLKEKYRPVFDLTSAITKLESTLNELSEIKDTKVCLANEPVLLKPPGISDKFLSILGRNCNQLVNVDLNLEKVSDLHRCVSVFLKYLRGSKSPIEQELRDNRQYLFFLKHLRYLQEIRFFDSSSVELAISDDLIKFEADILPGNLRYAQAYFDFERLIRYLNMKCEKFHTLFVSSSRDTDFSFEALYDYVQSITQLQDYNTGSLSPVIILNYHIFGEQIFDILKEKLSKTSDELTKLKYLLQYSKSLRDLCKKVSGNILYFRCFTETINSYVKLLNSEIKWPSIKKMSHSSLFHVIDLIKQVCDLNIIGSNVEERFFFENTIRRLCHVQRITQDDKSPAVILRQLGLLDNYINRLTVSLSILKRETPTNQNLTRDLVDVLQIVVTEYETYAIQDAEDLAEMMAETLENSLKQQRKSDFKPNEQSFDGSSSKVVLLIADQYRSIISDLSLIPKSSRIFAHEYLSIAYIRAYVQHMHRFRFSSLGAVTLIKDIHTYIELMHTDYESLKFLWQTLIAVANLVLVKSDNIHSLFSEGNLAFFDKRLLEDFICLREDYSRDGVIHVSSLFFNI